MSGAHRRPNVGYSTPSPPLNPVRVGLYPTRLHHFGGYRRDPFSARVPTPSSSYSSRYVTAPAPSSSSFSSSSHHHVTTTCESVGGKGGFKNVEMRRRRGNHPRGEPAPVENLFDKYDNDPSFTGGVIKCHEFVQTHFGKKYPR
ncbi:hypothetical protein Fcan01_22370 [Folsomia candida]|uniref:Uncharacterized protein n=1 Tax=Folsomia candida TaxID=158441 RepID=A0A226DDT3_FOLCA|nr:hypothetical protein Fcan01_22370 [Folsomia candida]